MLKWEMGAELPRNSLSVAKEGKVFEQKKLLQPLLGTPEGTKMTGTIFFLTSPTLTVYSIVQFLTSYPLASTAASVIVFIGVDVTSPHLILKLDRVTKTSFLTSERPRAFLVTLW